MSTHILISKSLHKKEARFHEEILDSKAEVGKVQNESESTEMFKELWGHAKQTNKQKNNLKGIYFKRLKCPIVGRLKHQK